MVPMVATQRGVAMYTVPTKRIVCSIWISDCFGLCMTLCYDQLNLVNFPSIVHSGKHYIIVITPKGRDST